MRRQKRGHNFCIMGSSLSLPTLSPTCGACLPVMLMPNQSSPTAPPLPSPGTNERSQSVDVAKLASPESRRRRRRRRWRWSSSPPSASSSLARSLLILAPPPSLPFPSFSLPSSFMRLRQRPRPPAPCASRASEHGGTREGGRDEEDNLSLSRHSAPRAAPHSFRSIVPYIE